MPQAQRNAKLLDRSELAKQLRELAAAPSLALRNEELRALAFDLESDSRLDQWAEVDLVAVFVRPESLATRPPRRHARPSGPRVLRGLRGLFQWPVRDGVLEAVLGVLVFVPLLVTWFGLREAVHAYGELSTADPKQATRPFLQLWQSGFGGHLAPVGRFENVALAAVVLITLLVVVSVWHARARSRTEGEEVERQSEQEYLLGRLASVLTRVQLALVPHRGASPEQFTEELSKAAKQINAVTVRAERSHKALAATTTAVTKATDALEAAARTLTGEMPKLGTAADRIEAAVRDGHTLTAKAGTENAAAAQGIADRIKAAGDTVDTALAALVTAQRTLATHSATVAEATERASQALVASTARTGEALDGMREATERWDAAAAHWQDAAARLDSGIRTLAGARRGPAADPGPDPFFFGSPDGSPEHLSVPPVPGRQPPHDGDGR